MSLQDEREELINEHNAELPSGTPDYILAKYLMDCLNAFHNAVELRTDWHNILRQPKLGDVDER